MVKYTYEEIKSALLAWLHEGKTLSTEFEADLKKRLEDLSKNERTLQSQVLLTVLREQEVVCLKRDPDSKKTVYLNALPSFMRLMYILQDYNEKVLQTK